ncbi:hypothetical protein HJG60_009009 [Phyllostomus discolor]|uniref:L1 transposable element RRM domain-containing protein n=1 Tax=Phyllostomus discolor TaxID=89673 RepID=A0A834DH37_9CHIR|nr:hypothetical protein HJG60_009009 [Phyllostomus discolor]
MKEWFKAPEKIQLGNEETAKLSDTQFKTLVIRMLQELTGHFNSIKKTQAAMKVALCGIKKNLQETNTEGKETRTQFNGLEQKEQINIRPEKNEETRIQKNEERLRNLQELFKHFNIQIIGLPEEKEDQQIENLFEQIMKENFPNLTKETDFQEIQEVQRVPGKLDPKRNTPRHIITTLPKIKNRES